MKTLCMQRPVGSIGKSYDFILRGRRFESQWCAKFFYNDDNDENNNNDDNNNDNNNNDGNNNNNSNSNNNNNEHIMSGILNNMTGHLQVTGHEGSAKDVY